MTVKTLLVATGLVVGATAAASAQVGWEGVAGPGTPAFGPGCYACGAGAGGAIYNQVPEGVLLDYAGPPLGGGGLVDYVPGLYDGPFHTGSNYLWFRPDGPGRGNSAESER